MTTASPTLHQSSPVARPADAYERWLQARAVQRSLNPYELVGIEPLETNLSRIRSIIERQEHDVAKHRADATPELWAAFHRDFTAAITILPDADRKAMLDAALKRQSAAAQGVSGDGGAAGDALTVPCAHCQQANPRDRKFCSACGHSLWDACPKCRAAKLASERFCGQCGQDVVAYFAQQNAHFEEQLTLAERLQTEARFSDARRIVRELARVDDPRFERHARRAAQLVDEFAVRQKEQEADVARLVELAGRYVAEHAYETAIKTLRDVPEPLRSPELTDVLREAQERQQEAERLLAAIRAGLEQKQTIQLLPLIERFLTLKPEHAQATKLAGQLAEQVLARAKRLSDSGDWAGALELLRGVPAFVTNDAMTRLIEECDERAWLASEVRQTSVLHPSLPGLAERLLELSPGNEEFAKLAGQLKERQGTTPALAWQAVHDWRAVPQRSTLGLPVGWWGALQRFQAADDAAWPKSRVGLGRWCTALGLALQAIGKAPLDIHFAAEEKTGVLGRLTSSLRKKGPEIGWGIDLNGSSLKAVRVRWDAAARQPVIEACEFQELDGAAEGAAEATRETWCVEALKKFAADRDFRGARIAVNLSAQQCLARFAQVPLAKGKKFDELVRYEARQQFPMSLDDLAWEYVDLRGAEGENATTARIMIVAAKRTVVAAREQLFAQAGIKPHVVQCDALATHNFLRFDWAGQDAAGPEGAHPGANGAGERTVADRAIFAIVDVGAETTNFVVSGPDFAWFRSFATAGDEFTKTIARDLKVVRRQAEQMKRQPHRVRKVSRVAAAWEPLYRQLRDECQRSLTQWKSLDSSSPPTRIVCVGGGTQTYGLVEMLRGG